MRRLYGRDHLDHVLGTFGLILFFNELVRLIWGPAGMTLRAAGRCSTAVEMLPGVQYPLYRLVDHRRRHSLVALRSMFSSMHTRLGMLIRAGASNREMVGALGVNIKLLYTVVFGLGAALAGLAGMMQAPILTVQIGMGENIMILALVVIIIGGIGSIRGAFFAALIVGIDRTVGRAFLPDLLRLIPDPSRGSSAGPALSSMLIYMVMAAILVVAAGRPLSRRQQMIDRHPPARRPVGAVLLLVVAGAALCQLERQFFLLSFFTRIIILALAAVSLNLIMGLAAW